MKYNIDGYEFESKELITLKVQEIIKRNKNRYLIEEDYDFIMDLFKYHDKYEHITRDMVGIYSGVNMMDNGCLFIENESGRFDNISFVKCIRNIPFGGGGNNIEFILPFGKYKDKSIYEINDDQYLCWLSDQKWLDRKTKIYINQFLRYGYIPYNSVMENK